MIYLSRLASSKAPGAETFSALWDSGATNTVIGRGSQADRLKNGYVVIHNYTKGGWATAQNLESKELHTPVHENQRIVVASGAVGPGKSVSQVNLLVKACTLQKDGQRTQMKYSFRQEKLLSQMTFPHVRKQGLDPYYSC